MRTDPFISLCLALADLTYDSFKIGLVKNHFDHKIFSARLDKQLESLISERLPLFSFECGPWICIVCSKIASK